MRYGKSIQYHTIYGWIISSTIEFYCIGKLNCTIIGDIQLYGIREIQAGYTKLRTFMNCYKTDIIIFERNHAYKADQPIIFITAKDTENDTVTGFNIGEDDYISKPFSLREVIARVKAVLRRTAAAETERVPERLTYQTLVIDITKKKVSIDEEEVPLTKKEFEILLLLVQNKGRVFSREDILARIWSDEVYVLDRTIDVNITRLLKKI